MSDHPQIILAGDIGGTKSNLAILSIEHETLKIHRNHRFPSGDYTSLNAIIHEFLEAEKGHIPAACFGVPGPGKIRSGTGPPISIGAWMPPKSRRRSAIPQVSLLNDLEANAYGIGELNPEDVAIIQEGPPAMGGNRCVVSPGTGLGEGGLFWDGVKKKYRVWACEGGHADFAPRNDIEIALLKYLMKQYGHVSYERVVSGMGLENIYKFLRDTGRGQELPQVADEMKTNKPGWSSRNTRIPANARCVCRRPRSLCLHFGAEAGNMALKTMATGGVYLGGGIPAKMLNAARIEAFIEAFNDKGRLSNLMKTMPVKIVLNDQAALFGAARYAVDRANVT